MFKKKVEKVAPLKVGDALFEDKNLVAWRKAAANTEARIDSYEEAILIDKAFLELARSKVKELE
jgi:hypothetical protein